MPINFSGKLLLAGPREINQCQFNDPSHLMKEEATAPVIYNFPIIYLSSGWRWTNSELQIYFIFLFIVHLFLRGMKPANLSKDNLC